MDPFFSVRLHGPHTIVEFQTASLMNAMELERIGGALFRLIEQENARHLVVDFTKVQYLSSQAIGIVLTMNKKLSQIPGTSYILCGVGPQLMQLLKITRLDRILKIVPTIADAIGEKSGKTK